MKLKPKTEALAFRIWAYCEPRGWDCLISDVAVALGEKMETVRRICVVKGWGDRMRVAKVHEFDKPSKLYTWDDELLDIV